MVPYVRSSVVSEHRSEVNQVMANPDELKYDRWFNGLTVSQKLHIRGLGYEGPAYGPAPDWIPLPEYIE